MSVSTDFEGNALRGGRRRSVVRTNGSTCLADVLLDVFTASELVGQ